MKLLSDRSLFAQIAFVMTGALLTAGAVNLLFILGERNRAAEIEVSGPAIVRFVDGAVLANETPEALRPRGASVVVPAGRGGRMFMSDASLVSVRRLTRHPALERRLSRALEQSRFVVTETQASITPVGAFRGRDDEEINRSLPPPRDGSARRAGVVVALAVKLESGRWLNGAFVAAAPPATGEVARVILNMIVLLLLVLAGALWIADRVATPLRALAAAAARVGGDGPSPQLGVDGPKDLRAALDAFNGMGMRVDQLLKEKDVMLGALGHDLRTPLTSLRLRVESMGPEVDRRKAVATIEEASQLVEDILSLARRGRSAEPKQVVDVGVVVGDLVEDYVDADAAVSLVSTERAPISCQPVQLRRALRNLIDNALLYGEQADITLKAVEGRALILIEDRGPGLSKAEVAQLFEPFVRGEASRNSEKGGAGLGLALTQAILQAQGATLEMQPRFPERPEMSGLSAIVSFPITLPAVSSPG